MTQIASVDNNICHREGVSHLGQSFPFALSTAMFLKAYADLEDELKQVLRFLMFSCGLQDIEPILGLTVSGCCKRITSILRSMPPNRKPPLFVLEFMVRGCLRAQLTCEQVVRHCAGMNSTGNERHHPASPTSNDLATHALSAAILAKQIGILKGQHELRSSIQAEVKKPEAHRA